MYTLTQMRSKIKRRLRQIRATVDADTEAESGYLVGNQTIDDAINAGRDKIASAVTKSSVWANQMGVLTTSADVQDYSLDTSVQKLLSVLFDTDANGKRTSSSILAYIIKDQVMEDSIINDPMYTPSITEPYCRLTNSGIRVIVSTTGTVTADKNMRIEFEGDLTDLSDAGDNSYLTHELDYLCMEWALKIITEKSDMNYSAMREKSFYDGVKLINLRG